MFIEIKQSTNKKAARKTIKAKGLPLIISVTSIVTACGGSGGNDSNELAFNQPLDTQPNLTVDIFTTSNSLNEHNSTLESGMSAPTWYCDDTRGSIQYTINFFTDNTGLYRTNENPDLNLLLSASIQNWTIAGERSLSVQLDNNDSFSLDEIAFTKLENNVHTEFNTRHSDGGQLQCRLGELFR